MKNRSLVIVFYCLNLLWTADLFAEDAVSTPLPAAVTVSNGQSTVVNPQDKTQMITQIRTLSQGGHYAAAEALLLQYKNQYGEDTPYLTEQARLWALTNQSTRALAAVQPLLQKDPHSQDLISIQVYAMSHPEPKMTAVIPSQNVDRMIIVQKIQKELLQGNYRAGERDIKLHENQYGQDSDFLTEKARYFALTNQPQEALKLLTPLIKDDPHNKSLLDIQAYAVSHASAVKPVVVVVVSPMDKAKQQAHVAEQTGKDPALFAKAAQAYMDAKDNADALVMINKAVALAPDNADYLYQQAAIADNAGDYKKAFSVYKQLYAKDKHNPKVVLGYARTASHYNKLNRSGALYGEYIAANPSDPQPWLEAAYVETFKGNFRGAVSLLDQYCARFGESTPYLIERARILATANRPTPSLIIIDALLPTNYDNYDLNYANTTASYYENKPIEMFAALAKVNAIDPGSEKLYGFENQTDGLNEFIRTPFRSNVGIDEYHSRDSDTVDITRTTLNGQYFISPLTSVIGQVSTEDIGADESSGLAPVDGGDSLNLTRANVGMIHRFNPHLALSGVAGGAHVSDDRDAFIYRADALIRWNDYLKTNLFSKEDYYDVSAKAVSLGVKQNLNQVNVLIEPCLQCYVNVNASYSTFSDTNTMTYASANLMRTFLASQYFNFNLGVSGQWDGFSKQLNDGYYNPKDYKYYGGIIDVYIKQSDNVGYDVAIGRGRQKDETFVSYAPANDYAGKAYFGIYQDWYLVLSAGYSTRIRSVAANPTSGNYNVHAFDASLTKRFN